MDRQQFAKLRRLPNEGKEGAKMPRKVVAKIPCPNGCGHECLPQHMWMHAKKCPKAPRGVDHPKAAKSKVRRVCEAPKRAKSSIPSNGCAECPFRGLESALSRDLLGEAIRGGMSVESAPGFVRRCLEARAS